MIAVNSESLTEVAVAVAAAASAADSYLGLTRSYFVCPIQGKGAIDCGNVRGKSKESEREDQGEGEGEEKKGPKKKERESGELACVSHQSSLGQSGFPRRRSREAT